ncbi:hypothetical protein BC629DRAFT_1592690 [Irpex lacteus]|nr:hypothetical protein BC629DRAFT_1592690 [Irpex lacteus]
MRLPPSADIASDDSTTVYESSYNSDLDLSPTESDCSFDGPLSYHIVERDVPHDDPNPSQSIASNAPQRDAPTYTAWIPRPRNVERGIPRERAVQTSPASPPVCVDRAVSRRPSVASLVSAIDSMSLRETMPVPRAGSAAASTSVPTTPRRTSSTYHTAPSNALPRSNSTAPPRSTSTATPLPLPRAMGTNAHTDRDAHSGRRAHGRRAYTTFTTTQRLSSFSVTFAIQSTPPSGQSSTMPSPRCPEEPRESALVTPAASPPPTPVRTRRTHLSSHPSSRTSIPSSPLVPPSSPHAAPPDCTSSTTRAPPLRIHVPASPARARPSSSSSSSPLISQAVPPPNSSYPHLRRIIAEDEVELCPDTTPSSTIREFFVITWGWRVGIFRGWDVAGEYIRNCSLAVYQTFNDPVVAADMWEQVVREGKYCRMQRGLSLPRRLPCEKIPDLVRARYRYLHPHRAPSKEGFGVIFRGLKVGVFTNWLLVAPAVVGIPGALFNGFGSYEEAGEAFAAAQRDGIVMKLTLREPMPARFFDLS